MAKKYPSFDDGEWVRPVMDGFGMCCCDCGLVHRINFRIVDGGKQVEFSAYRDNRATGQIRRHMKGGENI